MTKATFTKDQISLAEAIAKNDIRVTLTVWEGAAVFGPLVAKFKADDQTGLTAFWKSLAGEMTIPAHAEYWTSHGSSGRKYASDWAAFYRNAKAKRFDTKLAFSGGATPTVASVRAFNQGLASLNISKLTASLKGKAATKTREAVKAKPFCVAVVKDALGVITKGANVKVTTTKADKATQKINADAIDAAKADAAAIRSEAANDAKANTLASIVDFIAREADDTLVKAVRVACDQAAARLGAAAAI